MSGAFRADNLPAIFPPDQVRWRGRLVDAGLCQPFEGYYTGAYRRYNSTGGNDLEMAVK